VLAAKAATQSIPIVFQVGADPVQLGLVASLNRPGGNLTGVSLLSADLAAKRLELIHQVVPAAASIALLINPRNAYNQIEMTVAQAAARALRLDLLVLNASNENEFQAAFEVLKRSDAGALVVSGDPIFSNQPSSLVALSARYAMPTVYQYPTATAIGGLMSYGPDNRDAFRLTGVYAGRVLKGEKPADFPVQQSVKIDLSINLRTAKALGLTIPETLLATADKVIQ
jgi:putative ABC transport system substrate-binding protein